MSQILQPLFILFRHHKLKLLAFIAMTLVFFVMLFPSTDLGDLISAQVTRGTGVYVQFGEFDIDLLPAPGVEAQDISIEPRGVPPLKAEAVEASLALSKLIGLKLGAHASITSLFGGNLHLSYGQGSKAKSGARLEELNLQAESLDLEDLSDYLRSAGILPVKLEGRLKTEVNASVDPQFADQPTGSMSLDIPNFVLPSQTIMVDFNGVPVQQQLPTLNLGRVNVKNVNLRDGVLDLQDATIGDAKSEIKGKIKGTLALRFRKDAAGVRPEMSTADLAMDINVDKGFLERNQKTVIGGFLILVPASAKQETPQGTRLAFRMKINRPGEIPSFTPLSEKL